MIFVTPSTIPGPRRPKKDYIPYKGLALRWHMREFVAAMSASTFEKVTEQDVRLGKFDARIWGWLYPEATDADPEEALAFLEDPTIPAGAGRALVMIKVDGKRISEIGYFEGFEEHDREWVALESHADKRDAALAMLRIWREARR